MYQPLIKFHPYPAIITQVLRIFAMRNFRPDRRRSDRSDRPDFSSTARLYRRIVQHRLIMEYLYLLAGLVLILAGANYLTDGSVALAERFRVPGFLIGLTIVAVGTSTPELVVSFLSALEGEGDMAVGNVVGSNLFNVFIILGVCALIRPLPLTRQNIRRDLPVGVAASLVLCAVLADEVLDPTHPARIGRIEGLAMLLLYVLSVWTAARAARREQPAEETPAARPMAGWLMALMIVGGLAALVFGGEIFLPNAVAIARKRGVSESVIAITLVAGGTSLPELASSVVSVVKGRPDIALGNVVGSNIANILLILGLCSTVVPLTPGGIDAVTLGAVVLSSLLLFAAAFTFRRRALDRWEGVLFLAIYGAYLWWLLAK